jgi:Putative transmembrane protein (PGPGW)
MGLAKEAAMVPWLYGHKAVLWWLGALSIVTLVGTLVALPLVVARLPPDYFTHAPRPGRRRHAQSSGARVLWRLGKNLLGLLMVLVGVALLLLPGQGILTILIGLMLLDFPGKRRLERRLVQQPSVWRAINWMRAKAHQPALELPTAATTTPGERPETS